MTSYYLKLYLLNISLFFALDLIWLGVVAKNFYPKSLSPLLRSTVNWPAALLFYSIDGADSPAEWSTLTATVDVEAKEKESAILRLQQDLLLPA